ncbi:sensor histidine kinase [Fodinicurvata fenggangensis]|uniref:sensor histidine kinase n=1 Tax=Fodinicurvata fenggangensis TaxID=1121830 RepID=UPI00068F6E18|nr:HAMP domain-containing sensor histidine kinase [Fodinicurvata fenggangensis]
MQILRISNSATFRFALAYVGLFGVSVLLLFGFIYWSTITLIEGQVAQTVAAEITGLEERYRNEGISGLETAIAQRSGRGGEHESVYLLTDQNFQPVAGNLRNWPESAIADGRWTVLPLYHRERGDEPILVGSRSFQLPNGYRLLVGRDMSARANFQQNLQEALAWGLGVTLALGLGGGWIFGRNVLRRVDAVAETSRRIMDGDLSQRVPREGSNDEFDRLAGNLNRMLERIEALMTGMRLVSDSLAHDLRSPMTHLKGRIELTLIGPADVEAYRQTLEQALSEIDTIQATFNALLAIAEAESGVSRTRLEILDLGEVLRDVQELYEPVAEDKGVSLRADLDSPAYVTGHRQLLAQALANLLDNAIKYSPQDSCVSLQLVKTEGQVTLTVADEGSGIPEADRERVLERFVRLDTARSEPGSGLGLSLVSAVSRLHESELFLEDNNPGLKVRWVFPEAEEALPSEEVETQTVSAK